MKQMNMNEIDTQIIHLDEVEVVLRFRAFGQIRKLREETYWVINEAIIHVPRSDKEPSVLSITRHCEADAADEAVTFSPCGVWTFCKEKDLTTPNRAFHLLYSLREGYFANALREIDLFEEEQPSTLRFLLDHFDKLNHELKDLAKELSELRYKIGKEVGDEEDL